MWYQYVKHFHCKWKKVNVHCNETWIIVFIGKEHWLIQTKVSRHYNKLQVRMIMTRSCSCHVCRRVKQKKKKTQKKKKQETSVRRMWSCAWHQNHCFPCMGYLAISKKDLKLRTRFFSITRKIHTYTLFIYSSQVHVVLHSVLKMAVFPSTPWRHLQCGIRGMVRIEPAWIFWTAEELVPGRRVTRMYSSGCR